MADKNWLYTATPDPATKGVTMNAMDWRIMWGGHDDLGELTPHQAYSIVAWVRRCVELRCNALSAIPVAYYRGEDTEADWEYADLMPRILWMTEAALQIYGAAYWLRLKNPYGFEKGYRWLLPTTITPKYDKRKGLTHFERQIPDAEPERLELDDVLYFWTPNLAAEVGPGKGWVSGILTESGIARHMNDFARDFFERGAMPGTLLSVEGNPPRQELDALEQWWKRFVGGMKRAWETVAVKATVTPVVIGYPTKDLAMPELLLAVREQIAVAAGVPQTMLEDAANYATAVEHRKSFYVETIVPEVAWLEAALNQQVFEAQALRVVLDYQSMDVFQEDEAKRGQSLNYYVTAGVPLDLAMEMLGVDLPNEMSYDQLRQRLEQEKGQAQQQAMEIAGARKPAQDEAARDELRRWQRKAAKALQAGKSANVEFDTDVIDEDTQAAIHERLHAAITEEEVKGAFVPPFRRGHGSEGLPYP